MSPMGGVAVVVASRGGQRGNALSVLALPARHNAPVPTARITARAREVPRRVYVWWAACAVAFGVILESLQFGNVDVLLLTRDPDAVSGLDSDVGSLSMVGLTMWAATVAVLALTGAVVGSRRERRYLFGTAAFLTWLLIDDTVMVHDYLLPSVGVPDGVVYLVYLGVTLAWLLAFHREIAQSEVALLVPAAAAFALSLMCDVLEILPVFEDYAKLVGIATLLLYAFRHCRAELRHAARDASAGDGDPASAQPSPVRATEPLRRVR